MQIEIEIGNSFAHEEQWYLTAGKILWADIFLLVEFRFLGNRLLLPRQHGSRGQLSF